MSVIGGGVVPSGAGVDVDEEFFNTFVELTPFEVEHFVGDLQELRLEEVGDPRWLTQHERLEKLNFTAHSQAKEGHDEYVVDQLNTLEKIPTLIYDLILIEVWKANVWPLLKAKLAKFSSLRSYIPVYHEASLANLLECCLYHRTSCEEAGDALVDLVDWCVKKLRYLLSTSNSELVRQVTSAKECGEWDEVRVLDEQFVECEFQVCMCMISILRFLTDHRVAMPLAVTTRLLDTHDVLGLLVPLIEKAPWVRKNRINGRIEQFEENQWQRIEANDEGRLPKMQTQVWLAIYNLVMDSECRKRYELTSFRRENLLRLRRFINDVVVDQLPPLTNLHRTLEEISITGEFTGAASGLAASPFVVEIVAEFRETLLRTYEGRWQQAAREQLRDVFVKETPEDLKRLANMISIPKDLLETPPHSSDPSAHSVSVGTTAPVQPAWEALLKLVIVQSTASFFAAARSDVPRDSVILLSVMEQEPPGPGERLGLSLHRSRSSQLNGRLTAHGVALDAARMAASSNTPRADDSSFNIAVESSGMDLRVRRLAFVSQKGARRSSQQLRSLLEKPGRESLLEMYTQDVAEFSVPVTGAGGEDGVAASFVQALLIA